MTREEEINNAGKWEAGTCGMEDDTGFDIGFMLGAQWADKNPKQSPWISVKERLPDLSETVLVRSGDDTFLASVDFRHIASKHSYWFMKNGESRLVQKYDYFMQIPLLPKGGTQ